MNLTTLARRCLLANGSTENNLSNVNSKDSFIFKHKGMASYYVRQVSSVALFGDMLLMHSVRMKEVLPQRFTISYQLKHPKDMSVEHTS